MPRGRSKEDLDPVTGKWKKGTSSKPSGASAPANTTTVAPTATAPAPAAAPAGPTQLPEEVKKEISGFRKAMMDRLKEMGESESGVQEAVLDGLRDTAEQLVQKNADIFGQRGDKTVDQSAAYEIIKGIVDLGEQASATKTVEQKRKILQRLKTYKSVVQKVIVGKDPRLSVISGKILEMIENIEKPLQKESGMVAGAKEKITDFAKTIPERVARKIPLIGGLLGGFLQRRREKKEEEAESLSDLTQQISRAGRTTLYGKRGEFGAETDIPEIEPPIPGGTPFSKMMTGQKDLENYGKPESFGVSNEHIKAIRMDLGSVLANIKDIKEFILGRFDPAEEETKAEEAKREQEDTLFDMIRSLKNGDEKIKGGSIKGGSGIQKKGGGIVDTLINALGGGIVPTGLVSSLASIALPVIGVLAAAAGGAAIGYALYKNWLEPALDKAQADRERVLAKKVETKRTPILTDKGEAVYQIDEGVVGEEPTIMTKAEIESAMTTATPEIKEKLEATLKRGPLEKVVDTQTGLPVPGDVSQIFKSGESIEKLRQSQKEDIQSRKENPAAYKFNQLKDDIVKFDYKTRLEWNRMRGEGESEDALKTYAKTTFNTAQVFYKAITKKIDNPLSKEQKNSLIKLSPFVEKWSNPDFQNTTSFNIQWFDNMVGRASYMNPDLKDSTRNEAEIRLEELKEKETQNSTTTPPNTLPTQPASISLSSVDTISPPPLPPIPTISSSADVDTITSTPTSAPFVGVPTISSSANVDTITSTPTNVGAMAPTPTSAPVVGVPPVVGKISEKTTTNNSNTKVILSSEKKEIQEKINNINSEMTKLQIDSYNQDISNSYRTINEQNKINARRKELNEQRQILYRKLYEPEIKNNGVIMTPSTPSTDVGKATSSLETVRSEVQALHITPSQPPSNNSVVANSGNTNNNVNINNAPPTPVRNPSIVDADRGLHR